MVQPRKNEEQGQTIVGTKILVQSDKKNKNSS